MRDMMINNEQFWTFYRAGQFDKALKCSIQAAPTRKGALLFKKAATETNVITAISTGEFLYNYFMLDPTVIEGLDFARSEDLSNLFQLSQFAETIDSASAAGDMAQLQGYVAEQLIAQQLVAAGHDVEFPKTSNQAGWDIRVDGDVFQVKCGASKQIVDTHFEKYPEIPVYVTSELAHHYEGNPLVLTTSVSREQVLADTKQTLEHAEDLLDFEIPWITAGVSTFRNAKRMKQQQLTLATATRNVVTDTASRATLATVGQAVIGTAGAVLLPGAGVIVFPVIGAYVGVAQGGKLSGFLKKQFAKKEYDALCEALDTLINKMLVVLEKKEHLKATKWQQLESNMPIEIKGAFEPYHQERITLLENIAKELRTIQHRITDDALQAFEQIIVVLGKAGIHMYTLKDELYAVEQGFIAYQGKI